MEETIGIIGFGNMGQAIAEQTKSKYKVFVFDIDKNKTARLENINVSDSISVLAQAVNAIILAVKPQDCDTVLNEIKGRVQGKFIISIAAGITTEYIEKKLGNVRVVRAMPNMPAKIGEGITCLYKGEFASKQDLNFSEKLFGYLGKILVLKEEEELMHAATAVSGSGPAYVCHFLEKEGLSLAAIPRQEENKFLNKFMKAAQAVGFSPKEARQLASQTFRGTVSFLRRKNVTPYQLRLQVTSKGGTTEAAFAVLQQGGSLEEAIKAAFNRAKELSRG